MAEIKWIKLTTGMFEDEKIKLIEAMPDADALLIIWIKLLTLAGKCNANGFIMLTSDIPYTDEMLSTVFNRPIGTVRLAFMTFQKFGMIDRNDGAIRISNWEKHQNVEGMERVREQARLRMAATRERRKLLAAPLSERCATVAQPVTPRCDTDIEDKKENKKENQDRKRGAFTPPTVEEVAAYCRERNNSVDPQRWRDFYASKGWMIGKNPMKDWKAAVRTWEKPKQKESAAGGYRRIV